jgi:hypothetical protein
MRASRGCERAEVRHAEAIWGEAQGVSLNRRKTARRGILRLRLHLAQVLRLEPRRPELDHHGRPQPQVVDQQIGEVVLPFVRPGDAVTELRFLVAVERPRERARPEAGGCGAA